MHIPVLWHFGIVIVDGVETGFIFQAEDENDRIDPRCELQNNNEYN